MSTTYPEDLGLLTDPCAVVSDSGWGERAPALNTNRRAESFRTNPRDRRLRDHLKRNSWNAPVGNVEPVIFHASRPRLETVPGCNHLVTRVLCAFGKIRANPSSPSPWTVPLFDASPPPLSHRGARSIVDDYTGCR